MRTVRAKEIQGFTVFNEGIRHFLTHSGEQGEVHVYALWTECGKTFTVFLTEYKSLSYVSV